MTSSPKSLELPEVIQNNEFKVDISCAAELSWLSLSTWQFILISKQDYSFPQHPFPWPDASFTSLSLHHQPKTGLCLSNSDHLYCSQIILFSFTITQIWRNVLKPTSTLNCRFKKVIIKNQVTAAAEILENWCFWNS
jgi:hypothetical protein